MKTRKGKLVTLAVCAALVLSLGTASALAAANGDPNPMTLFRVEDAAISYSNDGGETWFDFDIVHLDGSAAYSVNVDEDTVAGGSILIGDVEPFYELHIVAVKNVDGVMTFSTDGGETWSETAPDGTTVSADGERVTVSCFIDE